MRNNPTPRRLLAGGASALALLAAYAARRALEGVVPIAVFRLAIPILLALVVIRVIVRVLSAALPRLPPPRPPRA